MNSPARQPSAMDPTTNSASEEAVVASSIAQFPSRAAVSAPQTGGALIDRKLRNAALIVLLVIAAGTAAWFAFKSPAAPTSVAAVLPPLELADVDVATVAPRVLSRSLPLSGSISPVVQATVKSKVGGEVEQVTVREGEDIKEGDVIARIDTRNLQAQYDREMAAVEKATADRDLATLNRDKNRALLQQRYISQNTYESTESAYAGSLASLKLAEAQARLAKINLDDAVIRAPFSGTIAERLVEPGEKVSQDTSVVELVDLRQMLLEAALPAQEIPSVRLGQTARFKVGGFGDRQFEGTVQRINPVTASGSRAITVYIAVQNPDRALKGGMFAQGQLVLQSSEPVLSIPRPAIREESGVAVVYTFEDGKIGRKQVRLGPVVEGNDFVEVHEGLAAGERVIVVGIGERKPGSSVMLKEG
jgi:membrane fusion protein (multidrug efflux system)